ncbi:MAG: hypothetical protein FJ145_11190 [Deltaproteobacteria bacterium]|nr:hypothetical protein [Deltaproteobacteria bacterium]
MKNGMMALDSDMHVYDPPDLYLNYMDKKWGDRIPRGEWPTDYPHIDSKWPHALNSFLAIKGLDQVSQQKILWDNCARLYGLNP